MFQLFLNVTHIWTNHHLDRKKTVFEQPATVANRFIRKYLSDSSICTVYTIMKHQRKLYKVDYNPNRRSCFKVLTVFTYNIINAIVYFFICFKKYFQRSRLCVQLILFRYEILEHWLIFTASRVHLYLSLHNIHDIFF